MDILGLYMLSVDMFYCYIDNDCLGEDSIWVVGLNYCLIEEVMVCYNIIEMVCVLVIIELFLFVVEFFQFVIDFCDVCNLESGFNLDVC